MDGAVGGLVQRQASVNIVVGNIVAHGSAVAFLVEHDAVPAVVVNLPVAFTGVVTSERGRKLVISIKMCRGILTSTASISRQIFDIKEMGGGKGVWRVKMKCQAKKKRRKYQNQNCSDAPRGVPPLSPRTILSLFRSYFIFNVIVVPAKQLPNNIFNIVKMWLAHYPAMAYVDIRLALNICSVQVRS